MKKFPWNCNDCPMLHTYDLSVDDLTYVCLWSKTQIDDCDRYKSAECPLEKHDEEIRADERRKFAECLRSFVCRENCGERRCVDKMDECVWVGYIDEFLAEYEKEQKQ